MANQFIVIVTDKLAAPSTTTSFFRRLWTRPTLWKRSK